MRSYKRKMLGWVIVIIIFGMLTTLFSSGCKPLQNYPKKQYLVTIKSPIGLTTSKEIIELAKPEIVYRFGRHVIFEHVNSQHVRLAKEVPIGWQITLKEVK